MPKCSYCGDDYQLPHGMTLVLLDGTVKHLCSSKCRKNLKMKRRKVRWVTKTKKVKDKVEEIVEEEVQNVEDGSETVEEEVEKEEAPKGVPSEEGKKEVAEKVEEVIEDKKE